MKNIFKHWHLPRYFASIYTTRSVLISGGIFLGGILATGFYNDLELELYKSFGSAIFPIATLPNAVLTLAVVGGFIGFLISQTKAAIRFSKPNIESVKENALPIVAPIATLAVAPAVLVAPVAPAPFIYKFPYTIPAGTGWKNITMEFLDDEHVKISVDRWKHQASYIDFNMADKRAKTAKPGKQWLLLKILADYGGEVSYEDSVAKSSLKKQKQMLSYKLKEYFSMRGNDPFWPYKQEHKYKIRFTLVPLTAPDGKPMVRDIEKEKFFTDDEPMEEGIPDPISDEMEDGMAQDHILDEQEANRYGFSIENR